jgi:tetratricopeptide (TPR) repeat protein
MRVLWLIVIASVIAGCAASGGNDRSTVVAAKPAGGEQANDDGRAAYMRGDYDAAIRLYTQTLETGNLSDRAQAVVYTGRGMAHERRREYDAEIADCEAAIRIWPESPQAYVHRAYAYRAQKAYDLALADLEVAIHLLPDNAFAYQVRGDTYLGKHQYDLAIASYDEAIRLRPDYVDAYYFRALTYRREDQPDRAMADLNEAIRLKSDYADAYELRGILRSNDGQYDAAMADFATAIRLKPNGPAAYAARGTREFSLGQLAAAAADFDRHVQLAPTAGYGALWLHLVRVKAGVDDADEFARNLAKADRSKWPNPVLALYHGELTPEEMRAAITQDDPDARRDQLCETDFYIGEYELLRKNTAAAKPLLQRAADQCPANLRERFAARAELRGIAGGQ